MSIEYLLKPRYKVIADWPRPGKYDSLIGAIYTLPDLREEMDNPTDKILANHKEDWCGYYDHYPHLFKKLEWWEERKPEEMPGYVKYAGTGEIRKVDYFDLEATSSWFMFLDGNNHPYCPSGSVLENDHWLAATEQEYTEYQKLKENVKKL
jgi:hypothetical protein